VGTSVYTDKSKLGDYNGVVGQIQLLETTVGSKVTNHLDHPNEDLYDDFVKSITIRIPYEGERVAIHARRYWLYCKTNVPWTFTSKRYCENFSLFVHNMSG